ncbi:hypothetical protein ACFXTO_025337 [Malus domestica]
MATTKSATSVEDSNDIDITASSPHLLDGIDNAALKGVENPIILQGRSGGLCLWWKDGTTIQILSANNYVIDTCIQEKSTTTPIHISWFYVGTSFSDLGLPWLYVGDFNELLWHMKKKPDTVISHGPLIGSNHRPLTIQSAPVVSLGPSHFSLEVFWLRDYEFLSMVANNLSHFSRMLSTWSKIFSNNMTTINKLLKVLKGNDFQPHVDIKHEVHFTTTRKLGEVWRNEELFWL